MESNTRTSLFVEKICRDYLNKKQISICKVKKLQPLPTQNLIFTKSVQHFKIKEDNKNNGVNKQNTDWSKHLIAFSKQQQLKLAKLKQNTNLTWIIKYRPQTLIPLKQKPIFKYKKQKRASILSEKPSQKGMQTENSFQNIFPYPELAKDNSRVNLNHRTSNYFKIMKKHLKSQEDKDEQIQNKIGGLQIKSLFSLVRAKKQGPKNKIYKHSRTRKSQNIEEWNHNQQINDKIFD